MRKVLLCFCLFLCLLPSIAQKRFEGVVIYKLTLEEDTNVLIHLNAYFKQDKIKLVTSVEKAPKEMDVKNETLILDFKIGAIDRLKPEKKKLEREMMIKGKKEDIPEITKFDDLSKSILGYECEGYKNKEIKIATTDSILKNTPAVEFRLWYAKELSFKIPDQYKKIQMVPLLTNGNVGMAFELKVDTGDKKINLISEAINIQQKHLPESVFQVPVGYTLYYHN
jgi:hypothetical protein